MKTGYTRASGFNLLTSVKRDGHYIVAVVLGGSSAGARDRIMADLIEAKIDEGATVRTASPVMESSVGPLAARAVDSQDPGPKGNGPSEKIETRLAYAPSPPRLDPDLDPIQLASLNPEAPSTKARPAFVSGTPKADHNPPRAALGGGLKTGILDGSTARGHAGQAGTVPTSTSSTLRTNWELPPARSHNGDKIAAVIENSPYGNLVAMPNARPAASHSSWMIQIGATPDANKAAELLARAKLENRQMLLSAQAFTEKVRKGSETLYRARFSGLEADSAERACKTLKHSGFSCFATKN